jgi:hypothetical protein
MRLSSKELRVRCADVEKLPCFGIFHQGLHFGLLLVPSFAFLDRDLAGIEIEI